MAHTHDSQRANYDFLKYRWCLERSGERDYKKTRHRSSFHLFCQHTNNYPRGYQTNRHYCYSLTLFDKLYNSQRSTDSIHHSTVLLPSMRRSKAVPSAPRRETGPCQRRSEDTLVNRDGIKSVVRKAFSNRTCKPEKPTPGPKTARKDPWVPQIGRLDSITIFQFFPLNPY